MIASLLAMMVAVPFAQSSVPAPVVVREDEVTRLSVEVAALLNSEAVTRVQLRKLQEQTFPEQFANDPNFAVLERQYAGITSEAIDAMMPVLTASALDELPALQRELAGVYAEYFTATELAEMLDFYRGPTGTKLISAVSSGADFSQLVGSAMRAGDKAVVTEQDLTAGVNAGVATMIRSLTDDEAAEVVAFGMSTVGRKLATVNGRVQQFTVSIANRPRPELEKQVEAAVMGVVQRRMGQGEGQ